MKRSLAFLALLAFAAPSRAADVSWDRLAANGPAVNWMQSRPQAAVPQATPVAVPDIGAASTCYDRAIDELKALTPFWAAHLCGATASPTAPVDCYKAGVATNLSDMGRVSLCAGASSAAAPLACYAKSRELSDLTVFQRVQLCGAAMTTEGPIDCYRGSRHRTGLSLMGRLKLCARR